MPISFPVVISIMTSSKEKRVAVMKGFGNRNAHSYTFDKVFPPITSQEDIFQATIPPILVDVMHGTEHCAWRWGSSGSGAAPHPTG